MAKWVLKGKAMMEVRGERLPICPGDIALYFPCVPHAFWVLEEGTEMCWFTVDGPLAEQFAMGLGLRAGVYTFGAPPLDELHTLFKAIKNPSTAGLHHASLTALNLFYEIAGRVDVRKYEIPILVRHAQQILHERIADPNLSAASVAAQLDYHRGSLSRRFHQVTGGTIANYLLQIRLQEAQFLLTQTTLKIASVARKCGMRDPTYFGRWFRRHTGASPEDFRKGYLEQMQKGDDGNVESYSAFADLVLRFRVLLKSRLV